METKDNIRDAIVNAANVLFYEQGYEETSFTHIADRAGISRGSFYHYFKTKDEILHKVVDLRMLGVEAMLEDWSRRYETPLLRLKRYVQILRNDEKDAIRYGCPMGTLNTQLAKCNHALQPYARRMFDTFRDWLEVQFREMGHPKKARQYALHILSRSQGISVIAQAYRDINFLRTEADTLDQWLDDLEKVPE